VIRRDGANNAKLRRPCDSGTGAILRLICFQPPLGGEARRQSSRALAVGGFRFEGLACSPRLRRSQTKMAATGCEGGIGAHGQGLRRSRIQTVWPFRRWPCAEFVRRARSPIERPPPITVGRASIVSGSRIRTDKIVVAIDPTSHRPTARRPITPTALIADDLNLLDRPSLLRR